MHLFVCNQTHDIMTTLGLMKSLWPDSSINLEYRAHYERYSRYIESSIVSTFGASADTSVVLDTTVKLLTQMSSLPAVNKISGSDIILELQKKDASWKNLSDDFIIKYIAFCFSLRLSMHIRPVTPTLDATTRFLTTTVLKWEKDQAISSVISRSLSPDNTPSNDDLLDGRLTLENLATSYGFKIIFVNNLTEHLEIDTVEKDTLLRVFEHKIFLRNELLCASSSVLPDKLAAEALDTLNLLLPYDDEKTGTFLRDRSMRDFHQLGPCGRTPKSNLSEYRYFRYRLAHLWTVIKNKPPIGIRQILPGLHGSNLRECLNFWLAAFVVVLTIFSIAFGITALVYAKLAYDLAWVQYQLSLAQACAGQDAAKTLPAFC